MNIRIAANDRDTKASFFHADGGANIGHEYLEECIETVNATFYDNNATAWENESVLAFNASSYPLSFFTYGIDGTYVRSGITERGIMEGSAMQIGAGYEGIGKGAAHGGTFTTFLIRSHRNGDRNSVSEVDLGWRHIN